MFNKRKILSFLLSFIILFSSIGPLTTYAADSSSPDTIKVLLDGKYLNFDVPPAEVDGRTLVPLRAIFEALGATINWDSSTNTVTGNKGNTKVVLQIDNPTAYVNDSPIELSVPGKLINNKTMVPARFIAESMNSVVSWDENTKTVLIVPDKTIEFKDKNLKLAIQKELNTSDENITVSDVSELKNLDLEEIKISSLEGLQYCINLESLKLDDTGVKDISQVSGLIKLQELSFSKNEIYYLDSVKNLTNLKSLSFDSTRISDISPLSNLTELESLSLSNNSVSNISVVKDLPNLEFLSIAATLVDDIKPISSLKNLTSLNLAYSQIYDIEPLKDNINLEGLNIYATAVIDISPLKSMKKLKNLYYENASKKTLINDAFFIKYAQLNDKAKSIASEIITPGMNVIDKELAIHDYIITYSEYDDEGYKNGTVSDEAHTAYGVLINRVGVCDGYAYSMKAILNLAGVKSLVVFGESFKKESAPIGHAWNMIQVEGKYYHVDATWDDSGIENGLSQLHHKYFNISSKQLLVDHKYDVDFYPEAVTDNIDYDRNNSVYHQTIFGDDITYTIDNDHLYKIDNKTQTAKQITDDKVSEIAYSDGWLFYINNSDNDYIYKIKPDGTEKTLIVNRASIYLYIINSYVYYIDKKVTYKVNRIGIDGKDKFELNSDELTVNLYYVNDSLYFKTFNSINSKYYLSNVNLNKAQLDGRSKEAVIDQNLGGIKEEGLSVKYKYLPLETFVGDWIYYISSYDKNRLYKVNKNGGGKYTKITDDSVYDDYYEIVGDWIYYKNSNDLNKMYKVKLDGTKKTKVDIN